MINENEANDSRINLILSFISEQINSLRKGDKKESIRLLSSVCSGFKEVAPYLSRILTIMQSNITDENVSVFTVISNTYGEIVEASIKAADTNSDLKTTKSKYELLQGFCIYNMKQDFKANQICGSLCLTSLIETCQFILQPAYMKYIWENIVCFVDKPLFHAKSELLNALISLIFASENLFKPFSTVSLYKILDFLTDGDWLRRKLALNVVYILFIYCQDEILPLKGHIVEFLRVLKSDKVKEVREVCMQTLKLFNEVATESESESEKKPKNKTPPLKSSNEQVFKNVSSLEINDLSSDSINLRESKNKSPLREKKKESVCKNKSVNSSFVAEKSQSTPSLPKPKNSINKNLPRSQTNNLIKVNKLEENTLNISGIKADNKNKPTKNNKIEEIKVNKRSLTPRLQKKNSRDGNLMTDISNDDINVLNAINTSKREINKKEDNTFVNSKMVIKRDPQRSIFKTQANEEFFSKAPKKQGEVEVLVKETKQKIKSEKKQGEVDLVNYVKVSAKMEQKVEQSTKITNLPIQQEVNTNILQLSRNFNNEILKTDHLKANSFNEIGIRDQDLRMSLNQLEHEHEHAISKELQTFSSNANNLMTSQHSHSNTNRLELSEVMKQMKNMSEKQIFLLDTLERTQENSKEQFEKMNKRIVQLESTVQYLVNFIKSSGMTLPTAESSNSPQNHYSTKCSTGTVTSARYESNAINKEDFNSFGNNENKSVYSRKSTTNVFGEILQELKNKNPTEAFNIALKNEEINLIKLIEKINLTQIKDVEKGKIEETVTRSISLMTKGQHLNIIIPFLKGLLVTLNYPLDKIIIQSIYDSLLFLFSNKSSLEISGEEVIDLNLLISVINSQLNK